ncbi:MULTISPECIES: hypothetical protein [unclassified Mycolicibacterium]|uniref:hypothetical protein n=1 Tax=unclassified Mycolicibacterium TaxID=2636767 RepID=UPI001BB3F7D5|nr:MULTISPECIES: hypothetical protein [unclassified Mycolicibacterium]
MVEPPLCAMVVQLDAGGAGLYQEVVGVPVVLDSAFTVVVGLFERGGEDVQAGIVKNCNYGVVTEMELGEMSDTESTHLPG